MANPSLLILAGDGIGPEVMNEVKRIIDWFGAKRDLAFDVSEDLVGGAAYDNLDFSVKPERGLLRLRKEMDLFANLRPRNVSTRWRIFHR